MMRILVSICALAALSFFQLAAAQYPNRPISIIVCFPAGGGADLATRAISRHASKELGQNITITNVTGGNGTIGYLQAASARKDGYTLVNLQFDIWTAEAQKLAPVSHANFQPIMNFASQPAALVTRTDSQWKDFKEFVAKVKQHPGKYNVGGSPLRGIFHQASALLVGQTGISYNYVPTGGAPETLAALVGNQVDTAYIWASTAGGQVKAGNMRVLALFADQRSDDFPDAPTLKEMGIDLSYGGFYGVGAPKGTPTSVITALESAFTKAYNTPDFQAELKTLKLEKAYLNSKDFSSYLERGVDRVAKVISSMDTK